MAICEESDVLEKLGDAVQTTLQQFCREEDLVLVLIPLAAPADELPSAGVDRQQTEETKSQSSAPEERRGMADGGSVWMELVDKLWMAGLVFEMVVKVMVEMRAKEIIVMMVMVMLQMMVMVLVMIRIATMRMVVMQSMPSVSGFDVEESQDSQDIAECRENSTQVGSRCQKTFSVRQ